MLLNIRHLGVNERGERLYHCQTHTGLQGIVTLYGGDLEIRVSLIGTYYSRSYPANVALTPDVPRIRDLEGGYQTISSFLQTWEYSSEEQRKELCEWGTKPVNYWRTDKKTGKDKRTTRKVRLTEDRPVSVPSRDCANGAFRVLAADVRKALKGTTAAQTIRILGVTIKRSILADLVSTKSALTIDPAIELRYDDSTIAGSLVLQSADGRARVTLHHGAGDKDQGRQGWDRRLELVPA